MKPDVTINNLTFLIREGMGLTQKDLAEMINVRGVDHSQISRFERQEDDLSEKALIRLADILNLSIDFIRNESAYPFEKRHLYKLHTAGRSPKKLDLLYMLPFVCESFDAIAIIPDIPAFIKYFRMRSLRSCVYAIAVMDSNDTLFLLRDRNPMSFIKTSEYLVMEMEESLRGMSEEESLNYTFYIKHIGRESDLSFHLFEKIQSGMVEKTEIARLFGPREIGAMMVSVAEKNLLLKMRKNKLSPSEIEKQIEAKISAEEL